ncbi:MAG: class I SAM-dependent methyltransferase, partial [Dehalococcoidales bacterium]
MTIEQALSHARDTLAANNVENPSLESELMLRHTLQLDRVQLYLELAHKLNRDQYEGFWSLIERRLNREPTAYITGHREFYGLDFYVDTGVLIPRPETELLVEKAIELARNHHLSTIADIGTG